MILHKKLNDGEQIDSIFLDFSKALTRYLIENYASNYNIMELGVFY